MYRALITAVLFAVPLAAQADVYRSVDAQGHVQYSDTPSPGAQLVTTAEQVTQPSSSGTVSSASHAQKESDAIHEQLTRAAAAREVAQATADAHEKQCDQAKVAYQNAIQARRLYSMSPDGQRTYLTDEQADQQRVNYRMAMDAACKDSGSQ